VSASDISPTDPLMECPDLHLPRSITTLSWLREAELGNRQGAGKAKKGHASGGQNAGDVVPSESPTQKFGMTSDRVMKMRRNQGVQGRRIEGPSCIRIRNGCSPTTRKVTSRPRILGRLDRHESVVVTGLWGLDVDGWAGG
jgi:hypothetical protein